MTEQQGKTFADLVIYAVEHPINPMVAPERFDEYAADAGPTHKLLVVSERNEGGDYEIHASLSNMSAAADPELRPTLLMLASMLDLLGLPVKWMFHQNIVHWYWPVERVAGLHKVVKH